MNKQLFIFVFLITYTFALANIINIPSDQSTIQAGIDVSEVGDIVLVSPGTYYENIDFTGKNITVASLFLNTQDVGYIEETVINGSGLGSVVTFQNYENQTAVLCGFTITNGDASEGGGINCIGADPQITDCLILGNETSLKGGGINFDGSEATVENVQISDNDGGFEGGGISCYESNITLTDVHFLNNDGGNYGGGIISNSSNLILNRVVIAGNIASFRGGGMQCEEGSLPELTNVTIYGNDANDGGGIYCNSSSVPQLENCIVWNNTNDPLNGDLTAVYSDIEYGFDGIGNIDSDPLFENASGDNYNLTSSSPCIDTGNPDSPFDPDGTTADMGALFYNQDSSTDNDELPVIDFKLRNFPNPFNPSTTISFETTNSNQPTRIEIYNLKGQKIRTFPIYSSTHSSINSIHWNGKDDSEKSVSSGVYFYKLYIDDKSVASKKMIMVK